MDFAFIFNCLYFICIIAYVCKLYTEYIQPSLCLVSVTQSIGTILHLCKSALLSSDVIQRDEEYHVLKIFVLMSFVHMSFFEYAFIVWVSFGLFKKTKFELHTKRHC